jgi:hypothetical protein
MVQVASYEYDNLGRVTATRAYDTLGRVTAATSFSAATGGAVTDQVVRTFNGYGQVAAEWQSHTGAFDPVTTPRVHHFYSNLAGGNESRLTRLMYPSGFNVDSTYTSGSPDSALSRPSVLSGLAHRCPA